MSTIQIGRCAVCEQMARLEDEVCAPCVQRVGRRFASLVVRVRHDPEFARACYRRLDRWRQAEFILRFGDPTLEVAPTELERVERELERRGQETFVGRFSDPTLKLSPLDFERGERGPELGGDR